MIELVWDRKFARSVKKKMIKSPNFKNKFTEKIKLFEQNPFAPSLKTHKLSGVLKEYYAFSIDYDYRVVFKFIDNKRALLIDVGSHDEVY